MTEITTINPPRYIKIGHEINAETGEQVREFCLPIEEKHGVNIIIVGLHSKFLLQIIEKLNNMELIPTINIKTSIEASMVDLIVNEEDTHNIFLLNSLPVKDVQYNLKSLVVIDTMKEFTIIDLESKIIKGNFARISIYNMSFMDNATFFVSL